ERQTAFHWNYSSGLSADKGRLSAVSFFCAITKFPTNRKKDAAPIRSGLPGWCFRLLTLQESGG
ncbi:MAG: hypothetical protein ABJG78_11280, partial [Cyclobacteriaceae bacterium]